MEITSLDNQYVKKVVALHKKKYRDEYNEFFIEGLKMVKEAFLYNQNIKNIFYCPKMIEYNLDFPAVRVTKEVISKMADTQTAHAALCGQL